MNDRCEYSQTNPNIRLITARDIGQARLDYPTLMLSHSDVNCLYFIISVEMIFLLYL